jgi:flavin reductase (DIM6/NTAB) family NADH-FMN oxidoreductase RutF
MREQAEERIKTINSAVDELRRFWKRYEELPPDGDQKTSKDERYQATTEDDTRSDSHFRSAAYALREDWQQRKKTALRMIPYGSYVLTAGDVLGNVAGTMVNWVIQTAFSPPLVIVSVKATDAAYKIITNTEKFCLNMLGKDQKGLAFMFFKAAEVTDRDLSGQPFHRGKTGVPILSAVPASIECKVTQIVEEGDHHIVVGEVIEAYRQRPLHGHPSNSILRMSDLGANVFYGG